MALRYRKAMRHCRAGGDEAGSVLVLWAVALVGLMACTALAVDLGNIAQTKQHAETAVQDAVLAAVTDLEPLFSSTPPSVSATESQAADLAEQYLEENYASVQATDFTDPSECPASWPAGITASSLTNCVGFFAPNGGTAPSAMAVAIPSRTVQYTFGRAAGLSSQKVSGVAFASLERATGDSGGFPFSYSVAGGTGTQCLKSGSGGGTPCQGFTTGSGQFGMIDSPRYRVFPGSSNSNGGSNPVIPTDVVLGFDHALHTYGQFPALGRMFCDSATSTGSCPYYNGYTSTYPSAPGGPPYWDWANYVMPATGQTLNVLTEPLFTGGVTTPSGGCTLEPLLVHPDGFTPSQSCTSDNPYPSTSPACPTSPPAPIPSDCPAYPFLGTSDTFGSTYPYLNGRGIAAYLNSDGESATSKCDSMLPNTATDPVTNGLTSPIDQQSGTTFVWSAYDACLSQYIQTVVQTAVQNSPSTSPTPTWYNTTLPSGDQIFSSSILDSPRFGQVPLISGAPGSSPEQIVGFADVYLDMVFSSGNKVSSILAWVFPQSMVSGTDLTSSVGGAGYTGGPAVAYLCTYGSSPCE